VVVVRHGRNVCEWKPLRVSIRTASCEGVGLVLKSTPPDMLTIHDKVLLRMRAGNCPVELPGRVVWSSDSYGERDDPDALEVGIKHDLSMAGATSRELYASWIVSMIIGLRDVVAPQVP